MNTGFTPVWGEASRSGAGGRGDGRAKVLVVGGGITGLAAAHRLRLLLGDGAHIMVAEGSNRLGGKIRTVDFAGRPVEAGAESSWPPVLRRSRWPRRSASAATWSIPSDSPPRSA
ncbi:hypothetical protein GCM10029992_31220 [Glycomyces albus]